MQFKALCNPTLLKRRSLTKTLLVMQLTAILLLAVCLQVSAKGYGQSITLSEKNAPLEKVFREIKSQCGYTFVYRDEWLKEATNVNIDIHNASLELALEACFRNQPLTYTLVKTTVVVRLKSPVPGFNPGDLSTTSSPPPIDI
jgi:iron complex outermembrane receptor protein